MAAPKKPNKEPLIHITKRKVLPWYRIWAVRAIAIIAALIVCGILTTIMTGLDPISVYATMIKGSFGTTRKIWVLLQELAMLLIVALALAPAYRMKFWNLGGEGQILAGGLATAACMIVLGGKIPNPVLIVIMIVAAMAAGAFWAFIPAFFKAKFNTNETLFTLMMNYVALQIVAYFIIIWEVPKGSGSIGIINQSSQNGWFPQLGNKYLLNILIVAVVTVVMFVYMKYSKHGYEISVVGESHNTARYVGIKVDRVIIRTLLLSGAICGLAGLLLVGSINHTITTSITGGRGFTAVMVAWLAKFDPFGMAASSFLLVFLGRGASEITTIYGLNQSFGDILTGIILFFIIGSNFFISYQIHFRKNAKLSETASAIPEMIPEVEGTEGPAVPAADESTEAAAEPEAPAAGKEA
ncbi:MAG: ABC transporter permease [Eubacterium sp.]|nr:ABC transporter permease [Eubacterium sp.]